MQVGTQMLTDWDHAEFKQDHNSQFTCPFESCKMTFATKEDCMAHLSEGYHVGTELRCPRCKKRFDIDRKSMVRAHFSRTRVHVINPGRDFSKKTPAIVRLISHMESSEQCGVKNSETYGHLIHIYSGGFLRVQLDECNRSYILEADEPNPEPAAQLYDHPGGGDW